MVLDGFDIFYSATQYTEHMPGATNIRISILIHPYCHCSYLLWALRLSIATIIMHPIWKARKAQILVIHRANWHKR